MPLSLCHFGRQLCQKAKKSKGEGKSSGPLMGNCLYKARRLNIFRRRFENLHVCSLCSAHHSLSRQWKLNGHTRNQAALHNKQPTCPVALKPQSNTWQGEKSFERLGEHSVMKKKPLSRFDLLCSIWNFRCSLIKKIPANKKWVLEIFGWEASNKNILFHIKYHSLKWDQRGEKLAGYRGQKKTRHSGYFQHLTFNLCMRQGWELLWDLSAQLGVTDEISVWS